MENINSIYDLITEATEEAERYILQDISSIGFTKEDELLDYLKNDIDLDDFIIEPLKEIMENMRYSKIFNIYVNESDDIDGAFFRYCEDYDFKTNEISIAIKIGIFQLVKKSVSYGIIKSQFEDIIKQYFKTE